MCKHHLFPKLFNGFHVEYKVSNEQATSQTPKRDVVTARATSTTPADAMLRWAGAADRCKRPLAVANVSLEGSALLAVARMERAAERDSDAPWALGPRWVVVRSCTT